jgi:methylmalonyl-CoA/ethylmalonyl-CoA epimerase
VLPIRSFDHTAIAVHRIEDALPFYRDVLGGSPQELSERPEKGFRALTLRFPGGGGVELIEPMGPQGFLHDFLARRGEGVHHLTFMVADLAAAVTEARAAGLRVVDEDYSDPAWQEAFISPRSAHGTIVQLAQSNLDLDRRREHWPPDRYASQSTS